MRTTKELLRDLFEKREAECLPIKGDGTKKFGAKEAGNKSSKVVYYVFDQEIKEAFDLCKEKAQQLSQVLEMTHDVCLVEPRPQGTTIAPSDCMVEFQTKSHAKTAGQFLADLYGFWHGRHEGEESSESFFKNDKTISCQIVHPRLFFEPNGLMDFEFVEKCPNEVVALNKSKHLLARRYHAASSAVKRPGAGGRLMNESLSGFMVRSSDQ